MRARYKVAKQSLLLLIVKYNYFLNNTSTCLFSIVIFFLQQNIQSIRTQTIVDITDHRSSLSFNIIGIQLSYIILKWHSFGTSLFNHVMQYFTLLKLFEIFSLFVIKNDSNNRLTSNDYFVDKFYFVYFHIGNVVCLNTVLHIQIYHLVKIGTNIQFTERKKMVICKRK